MSSIHEKRAGQLWPLVLGALGVVYGDVGTSPLYAMRECFSGEHGMTPTPDAVLGVLSLITWALIIVISVKYMGFVMRADNHGEGGILALMATTASSLAERAKRRQAFIVLMGLFGAALLYGDGMITPAISVLGAVEGLEIATRSLKEWIVPLTVVILLFLFLVQRHGTGQIGIIFSPVIVVWFISIGILGAIHIVQTPRVLFAFNPYYAVRLFVVHGGSSFVVLGAVFLTLTGGEALYADMGHFGRRAIQWGWFFLALPSLLLNYYGQGAALLTTPGARINPFYALAPSWGLYPMVILATMAAIIASQAVISGAFSLTRQAVQLGFLPPTSIIHTSDETIGQIYVPAINKLLLVCTVGLVIGFRSSSNLAAAYGVAVTTTMLVTSILFFVYARKHWHWSTAKAVSIVALFLVFDISFCAASLLKIRHGGWFPLLVGFTMYAIMSTWREGRRLLRERLTGRSISMEAFIQSIGHSEQLARVPGAAVFMSGNPDGAPTALLHNLKYNRVIHETTVVLTVLTEDMSRVEPARRLEVENLGQGFYRVKVRYGFMESPDVPDALAQCREKGLELNLRTIGYFIGHENMRPSRTPGMVNWRKNLFRLLSRNAQGAIGYFGMPPNQVVELGVQLEF